MLCALPLDAVCCYDIVTYFRTCLIEQQNVLVLVLNVFTSLTIYARLLVVTPALNQVRRDIFLTTAAISNKKRCLLIIEVTHPVVYVHSLLCVFILQYCNKVDFISLGET